MSERKRIRTPGIEDFPAVPGRGSEGPSISDSLAPRGSGGDGVDIDAEVRVHDARADAPDEDLDRSLRPPTLADFVNLGYAPLEAEQLLQGLDGSDPQELLATALRKAGSSRSTA
jgi:hypothetical protein